MENQTIGSDRVRVLVRQVSARFLPRGAQDLLRQILLFCGAYFLYRIVRGLTETQSMVAFQNAGSVISLEQSLGLFFEPSVHAWAVGRDWVIDFSSWMYMNSHFTVTTLTLAFIYLYRNSSFYFVRNMFMVAMGIALLGYALFPTAPPRFMPEWGFSDDFTGIPTDSESVNLLFNPFAAIPSMHVGFALMLGFPMSQLVKRSWAKTVWIIYPFVVMFVVVATANHWWFDGFLGALTAGVATLCAFLFAKIGPEIWTWKPRVGNTS